jgi:hypothetical protein
MRRAASANDAVDLLLDAVGAFSAGVMRDDAAALAVRILGTGDDARSGAQTRSTKRRRRGVVT